MIYWSENFYACDFVVSPEVLTMSMRNLFSDQFRGVLFLASGCLMWVSAVLCVYADEAPWWEGSTEYIVIDHDTTWDGTLTHADIPKPVIVVNDATLTLKPGTHAEIVSLSVYDGRILALGNQTNRITLTKASPDFSDIPAEVLALHDPECFPSAYPSGTIEFAENVESDDAREDSVFQYVDFDHLGRKVSDEGKHCPSEVGFNSSVRDFLSIGTAHAASVRIFRDPALRVTNGRVKIEHSAFIGSTTAAIEVQFSFEDDWTSHDLLSVSDSEFEESGERIAVETHFRFPEGHWVIEYADHVRLTNNWYGHEDGPSFAPLFSSPGERLLGDTLFIGWSRMPFHCSGTCPSNVLLLPGIKLSRLYAEGAHGTEDQLWPPNFFGDDLEDLGLDADGKSIKTVYTKEDDVLSEVGTSDIYASFIDQLQELKAAGTLNDYEVFSYDWRKNVEQVVANGSLRKDGELVSVVETLSSLATSSRSGKVTLVAHSNGGLVTKALMLELERQGRTDLIDQVVMVGAPQMGTPLSMLSLLYGYDESVLFGALISRSEARTLAEHMPGAYGLLPSREYFERAQEPLISFDAVHTRYRALADAYGEAIGDISEFGRFFSGEDDHRSKPEADDVEQENVLLSTLLAEARETHERLDHWVPPSGIKVVQLAGWGIDTVSGVKYTEKSLERCYYSGSSLPSCVDEGKYEPIYEPVFTVDGDKVVTAPSALLLPEAENVTRYWVDLYANNRGLKTDRNHKDLFEINSVRDLLSNIITHHAEAELPAYLKTSRPDNFDGAASRIRMSLYSPLDIHLYDADGHHTGPKQETRDGQTITIFEEGIPNSSYFQFGERKYVSFGSGIPIRVELQGYALGSYTLTLESVHPNATGEEIVATTTFAHLPTTETTRVTLDIPAAGLEALSPLRADMEGDGTDEYVVTPVLGGTATLDPQDITAPVTTARLTGTVGVGEWYTSTVTVTLSAEDEESGIEKTEYSLDNGDSWTLYTEPILLEQEGIFSLQYHSLDQAGNQEDTKTQSIQIDRAAPEAKVVFNPETQRLDILGQDAVDVHVPPAVMQMVDIPLKLEPWQLFLSKFFHMTWPTKKTVLTATLTDAAGHVTVLRFDQDKNQKGRIFLTLRSVERDGVVTESEAILRYKWKRDTKQQYTRLATSLRTSGDWIETHYVLAKDQTRVMRFARDIVDDENDDQADHRPIREKLPGRVIPGILTQSGKVHIVY